MAKRYNIPKDAQDEYGVRSQLRAAAAQAASARPAAMAETSRQVARKAGQCGPIATP